MECLLDWQSRQSSLWPDVSYEIRPLKVWAFLDLMTCWGEGAPERPEGGTSPGQQALKSQALLDVAKRVIPEHVRNLKGLYVQRDGQVRDGTVEEVCEEALLMPLAVEMISGLIEISEVGKEDEKK